MPKLTAPSWIWHTHRAEAGSWIVPQAIFDGDSLVTGHAVHIRNGVLRLCPSSAVPAEADGAGAVWQMPGILSRGFVDLQVNGGGGVLFNTTPTADGVLAIARAHRSTGTAAIMPTVITDRAEVLDAACAAVAATADNSGIIGIHIEEWIL